ncbi:DUF4214 domain-containing protein [Massilia sp. GCM10020059]|uniref:DUF4214 domain-containing protein n=1 Tax=Massilia agrisoli TaxID=2892444 RepID=A0ABS8ISM3_9BURK|nr:DUF4214 domain-containing protein [Massilia agrisoli]MCC6070886.1 DUF4214 domain-containing protein [Massilia agrisoli]
MSLSSGINAIDALVYSSWNTSPHTGVTLTFSFPRTLPPNSPEADANDFAPMPAMQQQGVRAALAEWAAVANIVFVEVESGGNLVFATNDQGDQTNAYAYLPDALTRHTTAVFTNNRFPMDDMLAPGEGGFTVLLHEIGHTLGLKHPGEYHEAFDEMGGPYLPAAFDTRGYTQMSYNPSANHAVVGKEGLTPMLLDIQAIQYLYGANTGWRSGDDVYAFSPDGAPRTVWDGGGLNTFDFTACIDGAVVDLRPGQMSSTCAGFDNVAIAYGATIHKLVTGIGDDTIRASDAGSMIDAGAGRDAIQGGSGNDRIAGGDGLDTVVLAGHAAQYKLSASAQGWVVEGEGRDLLDSVERIRFADTLVALDIDGVAGQVYRLYQAAFDRAPDPTGLGYWIAAGDRGVSLAVVAQGFIDSPEFASSYGQLDNMAYVTRLYLNVLGRQPDEGGLAWHLDLLERGVASRNETLLAFSESGENQQALAGVIGNGFAYTPFGA